MQDRSREIRKVMEFFLLLFLFCVYGKLDLGQWSALAASLLIQVLGLIDALGFLWYIGNLLERPLCQ